MNVRLVDEVYLDVRTARDWYDRKSIGLGGEFADLFFSIARGLPSVSLHHAIDETGCRLAKRSGESPPDDKVRSPCQFVRLRLLGWDGCRCG